MLWLIQLTAKSLPLSPARSVPRLATLYCKPFIPAAAARSTAQLGLAEDWRSGLAGWGGYQPGACVRPGPALFPKS